MKKRIIGIAVCLMIAMQLIFVNAYAEGNSVVQAPSVDGYTLVDENTSLALYADQKSGSVALYDKVKGTLWETNPDTENDERVTNGQKKLMMSQLEILYYDEKSTEQERNSQIACINKGGLSCSINSKTVTYTYKFPDDHISIDMVYSLKNDYLSVEMPIDRISEGGNNKLTEISVLPYFGAGSYTDNGYMLIPDGSGSIIEMNNGKFVGAAIKERIYGDDTVICDDRNTENKKNMVFPVIGINKNGNGLVAIVDEGDAGSYINAYTSGMKKNYNCTYFSFEYRATDTVILDSSSSSAKSVKMIAEDVISCDSYKLRYYPLDNEGTYTDMANCYRNYLISDKNFTKSEDSDKLNFFVNCYGAVQKQGTIFFIPATITVPLTTYAQAGDMMKSLDKAGIENIVFSYDGWTKNGITGKLPVSGRYEGKLGNKKQFLSLTDTADKLGVTFLPNVNTVELYKSGNGYSKNNSAAATLDGTPGLQYIYNLYSRLKDKTLNPFYLVAPSRYSSIINKFNSSYKLELDGISLKKMGYELYSDHHKDSCDRLQTIAYAEEAFALAKDKYSSLLTEAANAYAAVYSDYITDCYTDDSGFDIESRSVPFYQIVMSGYKTVSVESVNLGHSAQDSLLKAIETGSSLSYTFTAENFSETENTYLSYVYNSNYNDWIDTAASQYEVLKEVHEKTNGSQVVNHSKLSDDVYETTFANGVKVRVNYSKNDFTDIYGTVKSKNYLILG